MGVTDGGVGGEEGDGPEGASMATASCGTTKGLSAWERLTTSSPAVFVERIKTLVPGGIFAKPIGCPSARIAILASFTKVPWSVVIATRAEALGETRKRKRAAASKWWIMTCEGIPPRPINKGCG